LRQLIGFHVNAKISTTSLALAGPDLAGGRPGA